MVTSPFFTVPSVPLSWQGLLGIEYFVFTVFVAFFNSNRLRYLDIMNQFSIEFSKVVKLEWYRDRPFLGFNQIWFHSIGTLLKHLMKRGGGSKRASHWRHTWTVPCILRVALKIGVMFNFNTYLGKDVTIDPVSKNVSKIYVGHS